MALPLGDGTDWEEGVEEWRLYDPRRDLLWIRKCADAWCVDACVVCGYMRGVWMHACTGAWVHAYVRVCVRAHMHA